MRDLNLLHVPIEGFDVRDGCLCVAGKPVTSIADEIGRTPFYLYDRKIIRNRITALRRSIPTDISIHYAVKANPMPEVVRHVAGQVDGLDVASAGELQLALDSGIPTDDISFAGPGKTIEELEAATRAGICIHVESQNELQNIAMLAKRLQLTPRVALRINPDFELKNSGMKMAGGSSQFGIDAEQIPSILSALSSLPVRFAGFHLFTGSQCLNSEAICESQRRSVALAIQLSETAPEPPAMVNIGGGFGIPYFPHDKPIDLGRIGANLITLVDELKSRLPQARLVLELGRYVVGESGVYVCRVIDRKESRGQVFLVTDGGLHHNIAASGNFGQLLRRNYPVLIANKVGSKSTEHATVVGRLCTPLDIFAKNVALSTADIGDYVTIFQSGAYGLTASPTAFLSHPAPAELLL